jgi:mediator of RNA polymerase II transcription subunit 31
MPAAPGAVPSPMPYGMPPGSAFGKSDIRNSGSDRRRWKYVTDLFSELAVKKYIN